MRVIIATDAWYPQVNGVVRTLDNVSICLKELGHEVHVLSHQDRKTFPLPSYPEIQLSLWNQSEVAEAVGNIEPDHIHIATEGPLGLATRKYCILNNLSFTTGFHTRFAEYAQARIPIPGVRSLAYKWLRWFHGPSKAVLSPTNSITRGLEELGFTNVITWTRGVDHQLFREYLDSRPGSKKTTSLREPVMIYMGRLAVEKGIEDFLKLELPGKKRIIGDGPMRKSLQQKYPDAEFAGYLFGEELARELGKGDVFVFPSKTDTFGLVMLEAMACGLPVAAYPVPGPVDVIDHGKSGWMDQDLATAITNAITLNREDAISHAAKFTWQNTAEQFLDHLAEVR